MSEIKYGQLWARYSEIVESKALGTYRITFEGLKKAVEEVVKIIGKPQPGPMWVKGAPKERKLYHAKFKGFISDDIYDGTIEPVANPKYWQAVASGARLSIKNDRIVAYLDESPAEQPVAKIDRDWINDALVEFALWYHKSPRKDIANDSCEYLNDKLKEAGIEYIISEDERIIAPEQPVREVARVPVFVPCAEGDPDCCGGYTSNDGRSLCHVKEILLPVTAFKQPLAEWLGKKEK